MTTRRYGRGEDDPKVLGHSSQPPPQGPSLQCCTGSASPIPAVGSSPSCQALSITQHRSHSTSLPQCFCGQQQWGGQLAGRWGQAASKELPATSRGRRHCRSLQQASKRVGFPSPTAVSPSGSQPSLLLLLPVRADGERSPRQG